MHTIAVATWCNKRTRFLALFSLLWQHPNWFLPAVSFLNVVYQHWIQTSAASFSFSNFSWRRQWVKNWRRRRNVSMAGWERNGQQAAVATRCNQGTKFSASLFPSRAGWPRPCPWGFSPSPQKTARERRTHLIVDSKNCGQSILDFRRRQWTQVQIQLQIQLQTQLQRMEKENLIDGGHCNPLALLSRDVTWSLWRWWCIWIFVRGRAHIT